MAVQLAVGALKSRPNTQTQNWDDAIVGVRVEDVAVQSTEPQGLAHVWFDTDEEEEVQIPEYSDLTKLASCVGVVVDGNTASLAIAVGQYVILQNSTITGKVDGLYIATGAVSQGGTVAATDISGNPITGGVANDLKNSFNGAVKPNNIDNKYNLITRGNILPKSFYAWEYGAISAQTGEITNTSKTRLHSDLLPIEASKTYKFVGNGYVIIHAYNQDKSYYGMLISSWTSPQFTFETPSGGGFIRILLKKNAAGTGEFDTESISNLDMACYPETNDLDSFINDIDGDLLAFFANKTTGTSKDVTFTWSDDGKTCTINGTSSGTSSDPARNTMYNSTLPDCLEKGKIYKAVIESESDDIRFRIGVYDSNYTSLYTYIGSESYFVYIPKNAVIFSARLQTPSGVSISSKKISVRLEEVETESTPIRIPCCTYNIGRYNYGTTPPASWTSDDTAAAIAQVKEFFRTNNFDLFALQEGQNELTGTDLNDAIYAYQFPNRMTSNTVSKPYSPSLYSRFPVIAWGSAEMSSSRPYVWAIINVHGIPVYVLSVHLSVEAADRITADYDDLETLVADYDRFIILGDFNAGNGVTDWNAQPEYDILTENGWHTANGGWWGQFPTNAPGTLSDDNQRRLDTICTSSNIDINTYDAPYLRSTMPSDHRPLMCDLTIY